MEAPLGFGFVLTLGISLPDFEGILISPHTSGSALKCFPLLLQVEEVCFSFSVFPVFLGVGDGAEDTEIVLLEMAILTCTKVSFLAGSGALKMTSL